MPQFYLRVSARFRLMSNFFLYFFHSASNELITWVLNVTVEESRLRRHIYDSASLDCETYSADQREG